MAYKKGDEHEGNTSMAPRKGVDAETPSIGHAVHPHRGPHGHGHDHMRTGVQHGGKHPHNVQHDHHKHLTPLTEHTFGGDECYEHGGTEHHMGTNEYHED